MAVQLFAEIFKVVNIMKILKHGDERVIKIIKKKHLDGDAGYKVSQFVYQFSEGGRYLLRNTLTKETAELTQSEWKAFEQVRNNGAEREYIDNNGLLQLALTGYIVENDLDEIQQYQSVVFLLKTMAKEKPGLKGYTILPTTACNARCVYCYEEGYAVKTMTPEIADRLIDFICETRQDDTISLRWFGGEPTICAKTISYICGELKKRGVLFKSSMVTNASLITKELAHEMKEQWELKRVQVSLDGARRDYELRKRYISPDKHNYDVVMQSIKFLADEGIKIILRCNFDGENIDRLKGFIDEIKERFESYTNVSLYLSLLYQEQHKESCIDLYRKMFELNDYISKAGVIHSERSKNKTKLKCNYCMADSMDKSIVIAPDGTFYNCEHMPQHNTWGNIFDGITDRNRFDELTTPAKIDDKCKKCLFLPECTPFYKNGCPGWFDKCYEYNCLKAEYSMHALLTGAQDIDDTDDLQI